MDLNTLLAEVEKEADARHAEVLLRLLDSIITKPVPTDVACIKCNGILPSYVQARITLHRFNVRISRDDFPCEGMGRVSDRLLMRAINEVNNMRSKFHGTPCTCGKRQGAKYNNVKRIRD